MNKILVFEPRWHDRVVLVMDSRLRDYNEIEIGHKDFPVPFLLTKDRAREFPLKPMKTKSGRIVQMREIPIHEIEKEVI